MTRMEETPKRVAVFLFASVGELDVILPSLQITGISDFRIVVFNKEAGERIAADSFYGSLIGNRIENKALPKFSKNKLVRWAQFSLNAADAIRKYISYERFYFEYGNAGREKNIVILLLTLLGRASRIRYHPHGHAVTADNAYSRSRWPRIIRFSIRFGSKIVKLNGIAPTNEFVPVEFPILHPVWRQFVSQNVPQLYKGHVVILSRDVHPVYLLAENRTQMFQDVIHIMEKWFPGSAIVIKAHPRERIAPEILGGHRNNVSISYENTYSVVRGAKFAVSFWTSAFFQCIALGVPVVEYHIPHDAFRAIYPDGSLNEAFVPSFGNKGQLNEFVRSLVQENR